MRVYLGLALAAVLGFGWVGSAGAEPLNLKQVGADAKWVAHVDLDALRASTIMQKAHEQLKKEHPEAEQHLAMFREIWKFNPCTDLHGVTIYGDQLKKDTGVAIVHAKVDQQVLLEKAAKAPEHRLSTYGKHELHTWVHAKGSRHERGMTGAFYGTDLIIFGGSTNEVMAALDVLDGTKPNLAGKDSPLAAAVPAGAVVTVRAVGLGDVELPCKSPVVKQLDSFSLAVGEDKGEVFLEAKLTVKQTETAEQIKTIIEGGRAMAALVHGDDPEAQKILQSVKVTTNDKTVGIELRMPADVVWAHLQKIAKKIKSGDWHPPFGHKFPRGPRGKK